MAQALKSDYDLKASGLNNLRQVYWNLPPEALYEEIVFRGEGRITRQGALGVSTGSHTARAAPDKFVVKEPSSEERVFWGEYNRPYPREKFDELFARVNGYLQGRDLFVQDAYAGADPEHRAPVRIVTELAWQSLFARNMFIPPTSADEYKQFVPEFTVVATPGFKGIRQIDNTASNTYIVLSFEHKLVLIGVSEYAGEIKKSIFTIMNYLLPLRGVLSMHCSANVGHGGDAALFFGLSGTGKTTLSADPRRGLIGDDEHGWSDEGIFNIENGCYAKVIQLSATAEPEIYACTRRWGTILENVVYDPVTRNIDLDDDRMTENTRASYPLSFIGNSLPEKRAGHPKNIIFLTCDATGVMPPIARLTPEQAMYHFISGYTSKVAGTEVGLGREPELTFSVCFGAPFMVHRPSVYADLLKAKMLRHGARAWLLNTGWVGGKYGVGKRISIRHTRRMLNAALDGELEAVPYARDPVFGFMTPRHCPDVPDAVLDPGSAWPSRERYESAYRQLAARFIDNFRKYADVVSREVREAGPQK
ncbi:MAG: phosphoenolpyruvate carboxykinase (ATP) [Deltaproteobacteria bacterium]|nr:phosphoenolpyruvate carboxykinase (ATP) [Deltaproteobacteria bacterium]